MSLFPTQANRNELPLIQFKAGICKLTSQNDGSFLVTPDTRKGLISLRKESDRLIHFKWTDRTTNTIVEDLVVNSDVVFKKVRTGTSSDRVYILKWVTGDRRLMFWLQDKRTDNDSDNCEKINRIMSGRDLPNQQNEPGGELLRLLRGNQQTQIPAAPNRGSNALDINRILQVVQGGNNQAAPAPNNNQINNQAQQGISSDALRAAMSGVTQQPPQQQQSQQQQQQVQRAPPTNLNRVLSPDAVIATGVLNDPEVRRSLIALLPESQQSDEFLEDNLRSPQFQQAIDVLSGALQSENFNTVMSNLGLDSSSGLTHLMRGDAIGAFLAAATARGEQLRATEISTTSTTTTEEGKSDSTSSNNNNNNNNSNNNNQNDDDMDQYYS